MRLPITVLITVWATSAAAQQRLTTQLDTLSLQSFADGFLPAEMAKRRIPGAVLTVVAQGRVILARGYGFANLENRTPVDPDRTRFPIASVTKVFTATAALQLVEKGQLDLAADVNAHLHGLKFERYRGSSVTLHHLLTHTAGFEDRLTGIMCPSENEKPPLATYLTRSMPHRFAKAGEALSYSNHGMSLVALLVEEVSGQPFEDYVKQEILSPLGMRQTDFLSTANAGPEMATAYQLAGGRHRPQPNDCLRTVGAGGLVTTGTDMTRFMIAHLEGGAYEGGRIMSAATIQRMHTRQYTLHNSLSGWGYGFWEDRRHGTRGLMHDGGGNGYRALIYLLPSHRLSFFLAYNLADDHPEGELLDVFRRRFLDTYMPTESEAAATVPAPNSAPNLAGYYRYARRARTTMEKFVSIGNIIRIDQQENGLVTLKAPNAHPVALFPIEPGLYRRADARGRVLFAAIDEDGPQQLIVEGGGLRLYERISVLSTPRIQGIWLVAMALVFSWASCVRPALAVYARMRRRKGGRRIEGWRATAWTPWLTSTASGLNLLFIVSFPVVFVGSSSGGLPAFVYGVPSVALVLLLIPPVTAILAAASSIAVVSMWRNSRSHRLATRVECTIVCGALLSFVSFTLYWRLFGVQM
jgi:CubicO group peptidase (beta-lactamase class C family)